MPPDEPSWWYGREADARARLLRPLARIYGYVSERRMRRPPRYRARMPVICVGNFTAGGTGKTPLSLHIAAHLVARGLAPAFLTRGYGGNRRGPAWVEPSIDTAADVGDEPMLLARRAPTLISPDRAAGARLIEARLPAIDAIVMDDGLQNPALAKDLSIAVLDGRRGIGNGQVIPAGPLRARLAAQLAATDAIVVNHPPGADAEVAGIVDWLRTNFPGPVLTGRAAPAGDVGWLAAAPVVAFAGIANPRRFFDLLAALGGEVIASEAFADHHRFGEAEAQTLLARAEAVGATLVTTEKDMARLIGGRGALGELAARSRVLAIKLALDERSEMRLAGLVDGVCPRAIRGGAGGAP